MIRRIFDRERNLAVFLTLIVLGLLCLIFAIAHEPNDVLLRQFLYLFWAFFYEKSLLVLMVIGVVLLLLIISTFFCKNDTIDSFLSIFTFGLTALFLLTLAFNTLNLGLGFLYYPLTIHPIPPLEVYNPLLGLTAFILILLKGFLLEQIIFRSSSKIEKVCSIIGLGFGCTSFQVMILSYIKILYPFTLFGLDLFFIATLLLIYKITSQSLKMPNLRFEPSVNTFFKSFSNFAHKKTWELIMISAIIFLLFVDSYYSLAMVVEFDSLVYQANYAKIIYINHGALDLYGTSLGLEMSTAYPIGFQALGVYFYEFVGIADDFYMRILPPIFYFSLLLAVYLLSTEFFKERESKILCVFTVSSTLILNYYTALSSHYVTYLSFLFTMTLYYLVKYIRLQDRRYLFISSLFGGLASIVSYLGLATTIFLCATMVLSKVKSATLFLKAILINLFMPFSYLLRNLILAGDPLYPFLTSSSDLLWILRGQHFLLQSTYAGLQFSNPFSIIDFLALRSFGIRPWLSAIILVAPIFIVYASRRGELKVLKSEEKTLILFFSVALVCFFIASTFERYILPMIAVYSCFYVWIRVKAKDFGMKKFASVLTLIVVYSFSLTLGASLGGYKTYNPNVAFGSGLNYLSYYYLDDAKCWQWINEHTGIKDRIASFEIRYYYIEREIFPLDSQEAAPLYHPNLSIEEAIRYLKNCGVEYVLSPGWVSMTGILPAYNKLVIVPFLGKSKYFPAVFAYGSSAVYHVGPLDIESLIEDYLGKNTIPPVIGLRINLNVTLKNNLAILDLHVPGDFNQRVNLTIQAASEPSNIRVEVWEGIHESNKTLIKAATAFGQPQRLVIGNPELNWLLQGGPHVLVIRSLDNQQDSFQLSLIIALNQITTLATNGG